MTYTIQYILYVHHTQIVIYLRIEHNNNTQSLVLM